ncbi:MAG: hypothetical protein AAB131_11995, partial [Actinomycetota bacterium]
MPSLGLRNGRYGRVLLPCWLALLGAIGAAGPALAGSFTVLGPQNYLRESGEPVTVITNFSVLDPTTQLMIKIYNGGLVDGEFDRVSSSVIKINGADLVGPSEFNQNVAFLEMPIPLNPNNALSVELHGQPGGGITILIIGVDNAPPTITAAVSPQPNASGWNHANVTVTFTCQDVTSGMASCTSPVTVTSEGSNQVVTGTATDRAGNTASTSVTVKLDKTPPSITPTVSPAPNAFGWNNTDVTVSYACDDSLSGVGTCPPPNIVSVEGAGQSISASASDVAGNVAAVTTTHNLDRTPPTIAASASPAPNANGWNNTDVTVTFFVADGLSGVASSSSPVVATTDGANQQVSGFVTDRAGNTATA